MSKMLTVVAWNVKSGNPHAEAALAEMAKEFEPDLFALSEMYATHPRSPFHGYPVRQEATPTDWFHVPVNEHGETAALLAPRMRLVHGHVVAMKQTWVAPVHGKEHEPRRYQRMRLWQNGTWRASCEHWPTGGPSDPHNGPAVQEAVRRATAFLDAGLRSPSFVVGDLNIGTQAVANLFPRYHVAGNGPDNLIGRGCSVTRKVLGNYDSDHAAVLYRLARL